VCFNHSLSLYRLWAIPAPSVKETHYNESSSIRIVLRLRLTSCSLGANILLRILFPDILQSPSIFPTERRSFGSIGEITSNTKQKREWICATIVQFFITYSIQTQSAQIKLQCQNTCKMRNTFVSLRRGGSSGNSQMSCACRDVIRLHASYKCRRSCRMYPAKPTFS
jgi:hypothetical protein